MSHRYLGQQTEALKTNCKGAKPLRVTCAGGNSKANMRKTFNFRKKIVDRLGGIIYALTLHRLGILESGGGVVIAAAQNLVLLVWNALRTRHQGASGESAS